MLNPYSARQSAQGSRAAQGSTGRAGGGGEGYLGRHDLRDVLIRELLQDRRLARVIQTQDQQTSLLIGLQGEG